MTYDFTSNMDRRGKDALAIDGLGTVPGFPTPPREGFDQIPMWVADMNFPTCPTITQAVAERLAHPAFGYFDPSDEYFDAIIGWQRDRNGVAGLSREHIGYENGVLGGAVSVLRAMALPGDAVLVHSPTYIGFTKTLERNGYKIVLSPLVRDEAGVWRMDYEDMAAKLEESRAHVAIFCSPHNPSGRVWERAEIERAMEVYAAHDCVVISDEIWSDIILPGHTHIPTQQVSDEARRRTVALYAPSKTFNLAGLIGSYHVIYDDYLRDRVDAAAAKTGYNHMNVLSMHALVGAYTPEGRAWVDELTRVLDGNVAWAVDFIREHFEGVELARPQGTYMLFPDCGAWCAKHGKTVDDILSAAWDVGVDIQDGRPFHGPNHVRINLALPLSRVQEGFERLDRYVFNA
uniref:MalY/PatB family protein n=1 Tax=Parolsenella massiliensis TaxID=1871022 RepID=UPI000932D9DD|nr:aminotransferase class I/II-fold pyridoxal phosphate-dependent enzyme [Parolsenella massiliensis]